MNNEEQKKPQGIAKIENEMQKDVQTAKKLGLSRQGLVTIVLILLILALGIGAYFYVTGKSVYIENSIISAPEINLAPTTAGTLENVYVSAGDSVTPNEVVARVGDELIKSKIAGIVTMADATLGENVAAGQTVVAMIDPTQLRVVGEIDENKGLDRVSVGQYVTFTADAFGSTQFQGVVDEVSPEAQASDVVFQISDKRQEQVFDVKVRFDTTQYSQLKNGMSARMWVYTK